MLLAAGILAVSCVKDPNADRKEMDSRISNSVALDVVYVSGGAEVKSLSFTHSAYRQALDVSMNNENLKWNLESNRSWCTVVQEEHKGSGTVYLEIAANEDFTPREEATLTFVAGEFRGFKINVNQSASAFILSQPYFIAPKNGGSYTVKVTTQSGTTWSTEGDSWISVSKGSSTGSGGLTTTTLTVTPSSNSGASRYGAVTLKAGEETDKIYFWQFGTDLDYNSAGNIFFANDKEAKLSFKAPEFMVSSIDAPSFATVNVTENGDGTATVDVALGDNLSDCGETRNVDISVKLNNASASVVSLPTMVQDYVPAHGLVTGKGLQAFAQAVKNGTSTADWERNGVVSMIQDIDMNGIAGWEGIGTADKPFKGTFDGGGFAVINLKNTASGLFNNTKGATIKNVTLGKGSSVYCNKAFAEKAYLGGIVSYAEGTTISGCGLAGDVDFAGESDEFEATAYVGGIVGWCDATSKIQSGKVTGKVTVSIPTGANTICYEGGIAGLSEGTLTASEVSGNVNFSSGIGIPVIGGIQGSLVSGASASNNSYMGAINVGGSANNLCIGGLYGCIESDRSFDNASDKSVSLGTITVESFGSSTSTMLYAGGFAGKAKGGISLSFKGYEFQTNVHIDQTANRNANFVMTGGVLGGCDPTAKCNSVSFENVSNMGTLSTEYGATTVGSNILHGLWGGIAGFVNGPASFKECSNGAEIGKLTTTVVTNANTKHMQIVAGGIAGIVIGGDATFTDCENKGKITVNHYSNSIPGNTTTDSWYSACCASGILGAFDYKPTSVSGKLTMTGCTNGGALNSYRGCSAGIVAYARNAEITNCTNLGDLGQMSNSNAANKGGIACTLAQSKVQGCIAKCNVFCSNPASAVQTPAGIVSLCLGGGVTVTDCSWYGTLSVNKTDQPLACGGIVGTAEGDTLVKNCKIGGKVNGSDLTENNVANYAIGNGLGSATGTTYWNGNM